MIKHKRKKPIRCAISGKIIRDNKEVIIADYAYLWCKKTGLIQLITVLLIGLLMFPVSSALNIQDDTIPHFPEIQNRTVIVQQGSGSGSIGVNETFGNTLWWRLDSTNNPNTANWSTGNNSFLDVRRIDFQDVNVIQTFIESDASANLRIAGLGVDILTDLPRIGTGTNTAVALEFNVAGGNDGNIYFSNGSFSAQNVSHFQINEPIFLHNFMNITRNITTQRLLTIENATIDGHIGSNNRILDIGKSNNLSWTNADNLGCLEWRESTGAFRSTICHPSVGQLVLFSSNIRLAGTTLTLGSGSESTGALAFDTATQDGSILWDSTGANIDLFEFSNIHSPSWFGSSVPDAFPNNLTWDSILAERLTVNTPTRFHGFINATIVNMTVSHDSPRTLALSNATNTAMNRCTLTAGVCIIVNTRVSNSTNIFCQSQLNAGTTGSLGISQRNTTGYTVTSSSVLDTSLVGCVLIQQNGQ